MINLLSKVKSEITSYDRFAAGELRVIGLPGHERTDSTVKDHFTYPIWLLDHNKYPVIKVEGLEKDLSILKRFKKFNPIDIHLFVSQATGRSFKWHWDELNVFLYVIKGYKRVQLKNKTYELNSNQGVFIPKKQLHRVLSKKDTWALSIGFK